MVAGLRVYDWVLVCWCACHRVCASVFAKNTIGRGRLQISLLCCDTNERYIYEQTFCHFFPFGLMIKVRPNRESFHGHIAIAIECGRRLRRWWRRCCPPQISTDIYNFLRTVHICNIDEWATNKRSPIRIGEQWKLKYYRYYIAVIMVWRH